MKKLVACDNSTWIEVSDRLEKGANCPCPSSCKNFKKGKCSDRSSFKVVKFKEVEDNDTACLPLAVRLPGENAQFSAGVSAPQVSTASSADAASAVTNIATDVPSHSSSGYSIQETTNKYAIRNAQTPVPQNTEVWLTPTKEYVTLNLGGLQYSNNINYLMRGCKPLSDALDSIFKHWDTSVVFSCDGTTLDDKFVWLICKLQQPNQKIKKDKVDAILKNSEYSPSQKFFHVFYEVVYTNEKYEKGFYWSDGYSNAPLTPRFYDLEDFACIYSEDSGRGDALRALYLDHKDDILWFLGIKEDDLIKQIPLFVARRNDSIVYVERGQKPLRLGSLREFKQNMLKPQPLETMREMVEFLKKYKVTPYGVTLRNDDDALQQIEQDTSLDESLYFAIKLTASSAYPLQYARLLTLAREYARSFSPDSVTICGFTFTKDNYSQELKTLIENFWNVFFNSGDKTMENARKGQAWFAKSLVKYDVLSAFKMADKDSVKEYADSLDQKNLSLVEWLKICPDFKINIGGDYLSIKDYLLKICKNKEFYRLTDAPLKTCFLERVNKSVSTINESIKKYNELYAKFKG